MASAIDSPISHRTLEASPRALTAPVPLELLSYALEATWESDGRAPRFVRIAVHEHFAVLRAAQLVSRAFHAASRSHFEAYMPDSGMAKRWLAAMEAQGAVAQRASRLRILIAEGGGRGAVEVMRLAFSNLEIVDMEGVLGLSRHGLPSVRWLSVSCESLATITRQLQRSPTPSLRTLSVAAFPSSDGVPDWPSTCAASLLTLQFDFSVGGLGRELVGLERLVSLRSLRIRGISAVEMTLLFSAMRAPTPSVTHLSLNFLHIQLANEHWFAAEEAFASLRQGWAAVAIALPGLVTVSLPFRHGRTTMAADDVASALSDLIEADSAWPALARIEVGVASAATVSPLDQFASSCQRRGIELVPLFGCVHWSARASACADFCS